MGSIIDEATGGYGRQGMEAQQDASRAANATQLEMYNQNRADNQQYRETGAMALDRFGGGGMDDLNRSFTLADFQQDPGYQFRLQEGQKALQGTAAARGNVNSGATLKGLSRYNQDYANNQYQQARSNFDEDRNNRFNQLYSLAGLGQSSTNSVGQAGQNYANQFGQNVTGAANAQAAYAQQNNAQTMGMIGMGAGMYGGSQGWYKG